MESNFLIALERGRIDPVIFRTERSEQIIKNLRSQSFPSKMTSWRNVNDDVVLLLILYTSSIW